ncbi:MAG TPA: trypsin-like serine protease [Anaerolineales bacterium]|nr:trypsin-like serine protease [Anaerolineales bacterium]
MRKGLLVLLVLMAVLAVSVVPALAVTDGTLDGNGHPDVVLLLMEVGGKPAFRCSGTLLSPTVLLTAGHCTDNFPGSPYTGMRVFTESDVQAGIGTTNSYPFAGPNSVEAVEWHAHPLYETAPFFVHDVGIVILQSPGVTGLSEYGALPTANQFDAWKTKRGLQKVTFTSVGYGLQQSFPDAASWKDEASRTRYVAYPRLIQINVPGFTGDFSLLLSNNANTGGTCFGDSGGPNFIGDTNVVAGITSFGINGNCAGTGGVFRTDRQDVLDFIHTYLP